MPAPSAALFRALFEVGLDRRQISIHEMLIDILEIVAVAEGSKPAFVGGCGEGARWRLDALATVASGAGLSISRSPGEGAESALWITRGPGIREGEAPLGTRLGYPRCCVDHDTRAVRAEKSGDAAGARQALEHVWRTRIHFPYIGFNACPACLADCHESAAADHNRRARALAFALQPGFARALWATALAEAALATTGDFRGLDPTEAAPCPCGSKTAFRACCRPRPEYRPEFRDAPG